MQETSNFEFNMPELTDSVDVSKINENFYKIDQMLMSGLVSEELTASAMTGTTATAVKAWGPWLEIQNSNEFDVTVRDENWSADLPDASFTVEAGGYHRIYFAGSLYPMRFTVTGGHDVLFKWFTSASGKAAAKDVDADFTDPTSEDLPTTKAVADYVQSQISHSGGTVTSVDVATAADSHLESTGGAITSNGTITIGLEEGYSIPSASKQAEWDDKSDFSGAYSDLTGKPLYAASLTLTIDSSTYVVTAQLQDQNGDNLGTAQTIDLPLETMVVNGAYDSTSKKIILTLKNENTVEFSVADLVAGLQTELSASNKLDPDFIEYDSTHRAVSDTEKAAWNAKQSAIEDLATIRSGAAAGATAVQPATMTEALAAKQDTLSTAQLAAVNSGINSAKVEQIGTNQTNILSVQNDVAELQKKAVKVYTYHVNPNESDPEDAVTYLDDATGLTPAKMGASSFSYGSWANAWFLPRPCMLKSDGTVAYYLDPNDYSKKTDGTASDIADLTFDGNVMLEFPKIWVKRVAGSASGERTVSIAPVNVDGTYKCWSNINAEDKEVDHFYLPAYNGTIHDSKMRSLSGVTLDTTYAPNYTRAQEVTAATANNPSGKNMWYTETWADMCLVYDLLYLMGKSLDVQRTFGQGLSSDSETAMRAYVTGTHNAKGLFYGDISGTSTAVKVLGMENLWGCRWHGVAGLINDNGTLKVKMTYGVADGSTAVGYNTTGSGYLNYGSTYGTNGYVKKMQADNTMGYKIIETAGTDATYYCDYYYVNNSISAYALLGGYSGRDAYCGFCVYLRRGAAHTYWSVGGALSCRP